MELTNDFRVSVPPPKAWEVLTDVERIAPMLPGAQLQEIEGDDFRGVVKVKVGPITAQYKGTASFAERDEAGGRVVLKASGRDTRGAGNASATITATMVGDGDGTRVSVVTDLTVTGKVAQFGRGVLADVSAKLIGQFVDALEADLEKGAAPSEPVAEADAVIPDDAPGAAPSEPVAEADAVIPDNAPGAEVVSDPVAAAAVTKTPRPSPASAHPASSAAGHSSSAAGDPASSSEAQESSPGEPAAPRVRRIDSPEPQPVDLLDAAGGSVAKRLVPILGGVGALILLLLIGRSRRHG